MGIKIESIELKSNQFLPINLHAQILIYSFKFD